ncbi:unnamed protein product [Bursaphelenchus xylophilus]|uniref:(pine wood nematode) hypothetical protein n=1 Tax=Bursaphelenchus xylophilus TaxID=6326 RepID=A0A7I8WL02_BURXY|nr:unnamed protein product [Bursaphelenchus xylophilus]CAG9106122.1 unnamed protein product [Bursaphelenchus xylophilus]
MNFLTIVSLFLAFIMTIVSAQWDLSNQGDEQIMVPLKKGRPRGPPRFGKRSNPLADRLFGGRAARAVLLPEPLPYYYDLE